MIMKHFLCGLMVVMGLASNLSAGLPMPIFTSSNLMIEDVIIFKDGAIIKISGSLLQLTY